MDDRIKHIILASGSPRRKELLEQIGIEPVIRPSEIEEVITASEPAEVVMQLSRQKADDVMAQLSAGGAGEMVVLGADTVVAAEGKILGKPGSHEEAYRMIEKLQGGSHHVYTGVTLIWQAADGRMERRTFSEVTEVQVYPMSRTEIREYCLSEEPMDKAGAYAIQGHFAAYVKGIAGDYSNVVGLPIGRVYQELSDMLGLKES